MMPTKMYTGFEMQTLRATPPFEAKWGYRDYPNGTMDSAAAWNWVYALNHYDHGNGYLGHHDWQLPVTPPIDSTCAVLHGNDQNSFGPSCTGSALGNLYRVGLRQTYPNTHIPRP